MHSTVRLILTLPLICVAINANVLAQDNSLPVVAAWQQKEALPPLAGPELFDEPVESPDFLPPDDEGDTSSDPSADQGNILPEGTKQEAETLGQQPEQVVSEPEFLSADEHAPEHAWQEPPSFWARIISCGDSIDHTAFYFESELVLLHRTAPKARVVAVDVSTPSAGSIVTSDTAFRIQPGLQLTLGRNLYRDEQNRDHSVEFTFLGLFDWESDNGLRSVDPNNLFTPLDPGFQQMPFLTATVGGFNTADTYETSHATNLNSFEFNGRVRYRLARDRMNMNPDGTWSRTMNPGLVPSFLYGVRVVVIEEDFQMRARRDGVPFADFGGNYEVDTENVLVGFQFGGDITRREEKFEYGVRMKFGGLVNFAFQDTDAVSNDNLSGLTPIDVHNRASTAAMSFVGEADFGFRYFLNPNWAVRANTEMMWIQGLAVASRQQDFNFGAPPGVDVAGNAFYLGLSFGLEGNW